MALQPSAPAEANATAALRNFDPVDVCWDQKPQLPHCNIEVRFTSVNGPTQALCMKGPDAAQLPLPRGRQFWLYGKVADTDRNSEAR